MSGAWIAVPARRDCSPAARQWGAVTAFNDGAPPTVTQLLGSVFVGSNQLLGFVDYALLPSRGFALGDYRFNLWTRTGGGNIGIADLAQGEGTFGAVPEPASWALLIAGFGLVGAMARRRRLALAA
jgi:PEP-CTERM motif